MLVIPFQNFYSMSFTASSPLGLMYYSFDNVSFYGGVYQNQVESSSKDYNRVDSNAIGAIESPSTQYSFSTVRTSIISFEHQGSEISNTRISGSVFRITQRRISPHTTPQRGPGSAKYSKSNYRSSYMYLLRSSSAFMDVGNTHHIQASGWIFLSMKRCR
jgi:hypothetical protein